MSDNSGKTQNFKGYRSEEQKNKFTLTVGILGAIFLILQFVVPFIFMFVIMGSSVMTEMNNMEYFEPQKAVYWEDEVWFTSQSETHQQGKDDPAKIYRWHVSGEADPVVADELTRGNVWLLENNDKLWIISSSFVSYYQNGQSFVVKTSKPLGDITKPFLYQTHPAVIEYQPNGLLLKILDGTDWKTALKIDLPMLAKTYHPVKNLQVLVQGERVHFFCRIKDAVYYKSSLISEINAPDNEWEAVADANSAWFGALDQDQPVLFYSDYSSRKVIGLKRQGEAWREFFSQDAFAIRSLGACFLANSEHFVVLTSSFPGSVRLIEVSGNEVIKEVRFGKNSPFPKGFMPMMFFPQLLMFIVPFILAIIFTGLMAKHRICEINTEAKSVPFAPLIRRGIAQLIDSAIVGGPFAFGWYSMMTSAFDPEKMLVSPVYPLMMVGMMAFGFVWMLIAFFLFSFTEGKWGATPGKWFMKIRAVSLEDLKPCGFGRALIRNLLKAVDGFFSFMVGVMLIALSENWQRIGDMAARTVVIDIKKP